MSSPKNRLNLKLWHKTFLISNLCRILNRLYSGIRSHERRMFMDKFDGRSEFRHTGDLIQVMPMVAPVEKDRISKAKALLKEALEVLEKEQ